MRPEQQAAVLLSEKMANRRGPSQEMRGAWSLHCLSSLIKQHLVPNLSLGFPVTWANKFLLLSKTTGVGLVHHWTKHNLSGVMTTTRKRPRGGHGQVGIDHIFSARGPQQDHLGALSKIQVSRSGPGLLRSHAGHVSTQKILSGEVVLTCTTGEHGCYGSTHRDGEAKRWKFLENAWVCESQFQSSTLFFYLILISSRVEKNLCIKSLSIVTTRWEYYRAEYFNPACISWSSWAIF